jgi:hypothetical protein
MAHAAPARAFSLAEMALPDAALVATVDLRALRKSLWGHVALEQLLTLAGKSEECARSTIDQVEQLTLAIPAEGSTSTAPELGVIAEGDLQASGVVECATRLLRARGGQPEASQLGGFRRLRDKHGLGELAVRDGGPLLLSEGSYLRALLERTSGGHATRQGVSERLHSALRRELGPAPLLLTWVLPPGWLERWLEDPEVSRSPLAELRALALRGEIGERLSLRATLAAESAAGAEQIEAFLQRAEAEFRPLTAAALGSGQGPGIRITRSAERVMLSIEVDTRGLATRWLGAPSAPSGRD